jgi:hypothetical protein
MGFKKISSMNEKTDYRLEKPKETSPLKSLSLKDQDDEFDQLLNDFKGYQVSGKKEEEVAKKNEEEDEWF